MVDAGRSSFIRNLKKALSRWFTFQEGTSGRQKSHDLRFVSENPCGLVANRCQLANFDVSTKLRVVELSQFLVGTWRLSAIVACQWHWWSFSGAKHKFVGMCIQLPISLVSKFEIDWSHDTRISFSRGSGCYWRQRMFSSDVSFIWSSLIPRRCTR